MSIPVRNIIKLMRPVQWVKNFFIFLPMFFAGRLTDIWMWEQCILAFIAFSLASSSLYCFNDIHDRNEDRLHAVKRRRPIASGAITLRQGYLLMGVLVVLAFCVLLLAGGRNLWYVAGILAFYYLLNIAYSLRLKQISIVDVLIVAFGFVLRLLAGGVATGVNLSQWIVLMTFLLALFLALAKRRDDIWAYERTGVVSRTNIQFYNIPFVNTVLGALGAITVVCYIMYTVSDEVTRRFDNRYVYLTSVFVLAGVIRYLQIVLVGKEDTDPTRVLIRDRFLQICILCWLVSFFFIIYF